MTRTQSSRRPSMPPRWGSTLLIAVVLLAAPAYAQTEGNSWTEEGPSPILSGQAEGLPGPNPVAGAINSVAAHPTDSDILYVGSVNGGIWRTLDATSVSPTWYRLTSSEASQSIGTIEFDPTDGTNNTLLAGIGRFSSFGGVGGSRSGVLRTTDGGITWTQITGTPTLEGKNIVGVAPRGATLIAAVDIADSFACSTIGVWRSTNTGSTWTQVLLGRAVALASDPSSSSTLYAATVLNNFCGGTNGIHKSIDSGATWTKVSNAAMDAALASPAGNAGNNADIVVGNSDNVFVSTVPQSGSGAFNGVFRSGNGGTTWTTMDLPTHPAGILNPGGQGRTHSSIAADPTNSNIVYLGGDRQDTPFPNAIGAVNYTGNLARGDASQPSGSQWTQITHSGTASNSSPHADSRDMAFTNGGDLIETDDGGIYRRTSPTTSTGDWFSINSNLQVLESHGLGYDSLNDRLLSGNQDTGSSVQTAASGPVWFQVSQGDGGDVLSGPGALANTEIRYSSAQNLGNFRRQTFDSSDTLILTVFPALAGSGINPQFSTPLAINQVNPARIIIGGGSGSGVHESLNRGDTQTLIADPAGGAVVANSFGGAGSIAAGGTGNADMLYVAGCLVSGTTCSSDGLFRRTTGGGALTLAQASAGGESMTGATIDPDLASQGFGLDTATVYHTTDSGGSFANVTGNLLSFSPGLLRSIEYINRASGDAVVVGADRGVYMALASSSFLTWFKISAGIPNSPVFELIYDSTADSLFAGLFGSGTYRMSNLSDTCAASLELVTGQWKQISIPCDPGGSATVTDILANDLDGIYGTNWVVHRRDESTTSYVQLALGDSLSIGEGYWLKSNLPNQVVGMSGATNSLTDSPLTGVLAAPSAGCGGSAGQCNKVGHPHDFSVCWADVLVDDGGSILSLAAVDPAGVCQSTGGATCIMSRVAYKWNGAAYAPFDGATPGMEGTLVPWDGIWVSANKSGIELRIPATPGDCGAPAFGGPEGWFIRLIAESEELEDPFNVFGQLLDSDLGYDSHDLQEMPAFGDVYLTVIFPHPDWSDQAGNYASDYHPLKAGPDGWSFEVRSSDPSATVTLRWEGPASQFANSLLTDVQTGQQVTVSPDGSYTFVMTGSSRSFHWGYQTTESGLIFADGFESGDTGNW